MRQLEVARGEGSAKEGEQPLILVEDSPEAGEALQSTMNGLSKSGIWRTGPEDKARLSASNAVSASNQENASLRKRGVSGAAIVPKSRMNLR